MGYRLPDQYRDTYRLVFADPELHGLEVRVRRASYGTLHAAAELGTIDRDKAAQGLFADTDLAKVDAMVVQLGGALISWNLLDEQGRPVPCTLAALRGQDLAFVLELVDAWLSGVAQVQMPVRPEPVVEGELPMEMFSG